MEKWNAAQRAFAIKRFYKNNDNLEAARREFRRHFNLRRYDLIPSAHTIKIWVSNFEETGSALKKKPPDGR
jgi:transposase